MGGPGSGRPRVLRLVDDCPQYDVMEAARLFVDDAWDTDVYSTRTEYRDLWMAARCVEQDTYLVEFEWFGKRGAPRRQVMRAVPVYPHFGGVRWWWVCEGGGSRRAAEGASGETRCGRKARMLYLRKGRWACRDCQRLTYRSRWEPKMKRDTWSEQFDEEMEENVARAREWLEQRKREGK